MKPPITFFAILFSCCKLFAQTEDGCVGKCNRTHQFNNTQRISYYQYNSMNKYDVKYLKLDLNAETGSRDMSGTALTISSVIATLDTFITEFANSMIVDSILINGSLKSFTHSGDHIFVPLSTSLSIGSSISALIYYHGTTNSLGVYAGTSASTGLNYVATQSESYQAREWFPCKQILTDKIDSTEIWVTTSALNKVGSNGLLQGVDAMPGGKVRYRWKTTYPMNYYMPSISVGNYMEYLNYAHPTAMAPDSILIQHYLVDNSTYFNSVKSNLDMTPVFIDKLSDLCGLYPFKNEKYGHSMASIGGGMEHQTMTTLSSFGSTLIGHELGHQWFGDNVTCARWNDIWLNEGFATYTEYLLVEKLPALFPGNTPSTYMQNIHNSVLTSGTGSVYIPDASVYDENRIFSGRLSYNKGAAIIHNLRFEMQNDNTFFQTLKNYQQQFKDSVATGEDFKHVAEVTSGKNFTDFFNQWYYGEGHPTFNITYFKSTADTLLLLVNETTSAPTITPFFKGLLELKITSLLGDTTVLINLTANNQVFKFVYNKVPSNIVVDPNNWVLNQVGTITNGTVVPVQLTSLTGTANDKCLYHIQWETAQEINVIRYELECSNDGVHYFKIGETNPFKRNQNIYQLNYEDASGNKTYFRIKIIETDGSFVYSNSLNISSVCNPGFALNIAPNPVENIMSISLQMPSKGIATISLLNNIGQVLRKENKLLLRGKNSWNWSDLNSLSSGTYLLRVQNEYGQIITRKFIKK